MRKLPKEDRDIVVRAITAAARELGGESPWFPEVVTWYLDNVPALSGLFGHEWRMFWEIEATHDPAISRDKHIAAVIPKYGYKASDVDTVRRRYDRWRQRLGAIYDPYDDLGYFVWQCLEHLFPPPRDPSGDRCTFYI